jgi:hypothetical protein
MMIQNTLNYSIGMAQVLSLFEMTQRVFDVQKDSQFIEPRAKTNENPTSSQALACLRCKLIVD